MENAFCSLKLPKIQRMCFYIRWNGMEWLNPLNIGVEGYIESISDYNFDFHSFSNDDIIIMSCLLYIRMYI